MVKICKTMLKLGRRMNFDAIPSTFIRNPVSPLGFPLRALDDCLRLETLPPVATYESHVLTF